MLVDFPGILFGILVFFLREPARNIDIAAAETNRSKADWKTLLSNKSFVLLCLGYALLICPVSCLLSAICLWLGSHSLSGSPMDNISRQQVLKIKKAA